MDKVKHKYNPDYYYEKATQVLETVGNSEIEAWYMHSCTQALLLLLEGDLSNIITSWKDGAYTSTTSDQTLQLNSKHLGMAQTIDNIIDHIREMKQRRAGEE